MVWVQIMTKSAHRDNILYKNPTEPGRGQLDQVCPQQSCMLPIIYHGFYTYFSYCRLPVTLNQWRLTSLMNKAFLHSELPLTVGDHGLCLVFAGHGPSGTSGDTLTTQLVINRYWAQLGLPFIRALYSALCAVLFSFGPDTEPVFGGGSHTIPNPVYSVQVLGCFWVSLLVHSPPSDSTLSPVFCILVFFSSVSRRPPYCLVLAAIWCFLRGSGVYMPCPVNSALG